MAVDTLKRLTVEEYLEQERRAETKSEYLDGEVLAMPGARRLAAIGCELPLGAVYEGVLG